MLPTVMLPTVASAELPSQSGLQDEGYDEAGVGIGASSVHRHGLRAAGSREPGIGLGCTRRRMRAARQRARMAERAGTAVHEFMSSRVTPAAEQRARAPLHVRVQ